jgi:hypothetical protein
MPILHFLFLRCLKKIETYDIGVSPFHGLIIKLKFLVKTLLYVGKIFYKKLKYTYTKYTTLYVKYI